jgi:two-component sensor histidine kinase
MRPYFRWGDRLGGLPVPARWLASAALVGMAFGVRYQIFGVTAEAPFLFFFPAIIVSSVFLDRETGFFSTFLSAALATYYFIVPVRSFAIERPADIVNLLLFCAIGCFIAFLVGLLQAAYREVEDAHVIEAGLRARAEADERERDLLLTDLHHRIKNDLSRVSAIIAERAVGASAETAAALQEAANRVHLIARLHDRLRHRHGESTVAMAEFLKDVVDDMQAGVGDRIAISLAADPIALPIDAAGSVGLILNKLITNTLKHALFNNQRASSIRVTFQRRSDQIALVVEDNADGLSPESSSGMGLRIVEALSSQLNGCIETTTLSRGTRYELLFPMEG